jgi:hypothetical protein
VRSFEWRAKYRDGDDRTQTEQGTEALDARTLKEALDLVAELIPPHTFWLELYDNGTGQVYRWDVHDYGRELEFRRRAG